MDIAISASAEGANRISAQMAASQTTKKTPQRSMKENKDAELTIIYPKSMPSYLRIDADVKNALMHVAKLSREYATFNIDELEWKMQRKLEIELDRHSVLYKAHKAEVQKSLASVQDLLQEAL